MRVSGGLRGTFWLVRDRRLMNDRVERVRGSHRYEMWSDMVLGAGADSGYSCW